MKVWMVHVETGMYTDHDYRVCGVFHSREKAVGYVMAQSIEDDGLGSVIHPVDHGGGHYVLNEYGPIDCIEDWFVTEYELDQGAVIERKDGCLTTGFERG